MTGWTLNKFLRDYLEGETDNLGAKVSSHSFRAGLATSLARLGYGEEVIKNIGRWKSQAYNLYVKRGRVENIRRQQEVFGHMLWP